MDVTDDWAPCLGMTGLDRDREKDRSWRRATDGVREGVAEAGPMKDCVVGRPARFAPPSPMREFRWKDVREKVRRKDGRRWWFDWAGVVAEEWESGAMWL